MFMHYSDALFIFIVFLFFAVARIFFNALFLNALKIDELFAFKFKLLINQYSCIIFIHYSFLTIRFFLLLCALYCQLFSFFQ